MLLQSEDPEDWKKASHEFRQLMDVDTTESTYVYFYGLALWKMSLKTWNEATACCREKCLPWERERERAAEWFRNHGNEFPEPEYEVIEDEYGRIVRQQSARYRRYVGYRNTAVEVEKKAQQNIDMIWNTFEQNEKTGILTDLERAVSLMERAVDMGNDAFKPVAVECRRMLDGIKIKGR